MVSGSEMLGTCPMKLRFIWRLAALEAREGPTISEIEFLEK